MMSVSTLYRFKCSIKRINLSSYLRYCGRASWFLFYFLSILCMLLLLSRLIRATFNTLLSCSTVILIWFLCSHMFELNKWRQVLLTYLLTVLLYWWNNTDRRSTANWRSVSWSFWLSIWFWLLSSFNSFWRSRISDSRNIVLYSSNVLSSNAEKHVRIFRQDTLQL